MYLYKRPSIHFPVWSQFWIGKVQVSKKLIIWLSIGFINRNLQVCDTVATMTTQNKQNEETLWWRMSQLSIAMFTFWRIWFQNGIISNRAIQGQELVLMVNFSLISNEESSSYISHISLPYLYTCLNVSLYYIQLIHKFVIEKGSTIDTIPARSNLNKNIDSRK